MSQTAVATGVDELVRDKLLPLRDRILDAFEAKHPHMSNMIGAVLNNGANKLGMQITENGQVVGQYTFHFGGIRIQNMESGKLDSLINHPLFGVIKPYAVIERSALEKMLDDEDNLTKEPFSTGVKYLPDVTIKFLH